MTASFHKDITSGLYFTTFANILPKLRYFEGRNCFPDKPMEGGDILDF